MFEHQLGKLEGPVHLEVDPTVSPVKMAVRKFPAALKEELENELERLEGTGVLEKVTIPTDWVSSLVVEGKKNGKIHLCVDPKPLNEALKRCHYPLPIVDNILPELTKVKVFSLVDARNGFWHVEEDRESSLLTMMATPFGRY